MRTHSRLWNRVLRVRPTVLRAGRITKNRVWLDSNQIYDSKEMAYFLCVINYMLQTVNPKSHFVEKFIDLCADYEHVISPQEMGFPENWKESKLWKL